MENTMDKKEIVKYLREGVVGSDVAKTDAFLDALMTEAADLIERLDKSNDNPSEYKHVVILTEYERGWGSDTFSAKYYKTEKEAKAWADEYNRINNPPGPAPDYYIKASYVEKMTKEAFDHINNH
jgi:hypothetical protein